MEAPAQIQSLLQKLFIDQPAYGQIASASVKGVPSVRTVHIHLQLESNRVLINTNTRSEKWIDLADHPYISGCYWNRSQKIQIRFQAHAQRIDNKLHTDEALLQHMWMTMRDQVRLAYHLDDQNIPLYQAEVDIDPTPRSASHGVIAGDVFQWDVFWESPIEYRFGKRSIFTKTPHATWEKKDVSSLHQQPILL